MCQDDIVIHTGQQLAHRHMGRVNVQKALLEFFRGSLTRYSDVKSDATVRPCPRARNNSKYKYKSTSKQKYTHTYRLSQKMQNKIITKIECFGAEFYHEHDLGALDPAQS